MPIFSPPIETGPGDAWYQVPLPVLNGGPLSGGTETGPSDDYEFFAKYPACTPYGYVPHAEGGASLSINGPIDGVTVEAIWVAYLRSRTRTAVSTPTSAGADAGSSGALYTSCPTITDDPTGGINNGRHQGSVVDVQER